MGELFHFLDFDSACPVFPHNSASRIDPYYAQWWLGGSEASWMTREQVDEMQRSGFGKVRATEARYDPDDDFFEAFSQRRGRRFRRLAGLATLISWRTMTDSQIAASVGQESTWLWMHGDMLDLWSLGLVNRGRLVTPLVNSKYPSLFRTLKSKQARSLLERLPYMDWLGVTGSLPVDRGTTHDRHNILCAELCLRYAEYGNIGAIYGEHFAALSNLIRFPPRSWKGKSMRAAGDGVIVRRDGFRIAIELTASVTPGLENKIRRWFFSMSESDFDDEGLTVLFLVADREDAEALPFRKTQEMIENVLAEFPQTKRRRMGERVALAHWRDWFPLQYIATDKFLPMTVLRPSGDSQHRWEPASLLDTESVAFDPTHPEIAAAPLINRAFLYSMPFWMQNADTAGQYDYLVDLFRSRHG